DEREKEAQHMTTKTDAKHFPDAGHEEDQSEDEPREKNGPTFCGDIAHRKMKNTAPRRQRRRSEEIGVHRLAHVEDNEQHEHQERHDLLHLSCASESW